MATRTGRAAGPGRDDLALPRGSDTVVTTDDGARLAVTVAGPPPGDGLAPVVLTHCWTGSRAVWAPVARRLAPHAPPWPADWRPFAPRSPGAWR